jgi:ADP-heptose:LPS heptosyltransferase
MDVIVSVDTSVAHLAGAMGQPVFLLLPLVPDWRWGIHGEKTVWYQSMTIFRQIQKNDWSIPLKRVAESLQEKKQIWQNKRY